MRIAALSCLFVLQVVSGAAAQEPNDSAQSNGTAASAGVATITGYTNVRDKYQRVVIMRVDQQKVQGPGFFSSKSNSATLSPGRHTIDVTLQLSDSSANGRLWLDAEAGKAYIVRKRIAGYSVQFWIEEIATGRAVGGTESG